MKQCGEQRQACEIGRNEEWRDLASVPSPMPSPAWFWNRDSGSYACSQHPASNGLLIPVANAGRSYPSSDGLDRRRKSKRHETVWRAVASCKGSWDSRRRNLATIPEILPGATRLDDKRSATRRIYPSACSSTGSYASADAIGFTVFMAAASSSTGWKRRVDRRRIRSPQQAQYHCPGSTVVWVNDHSHSYHFRGTRDYGHTKSARRRLRLQVIAQR
jgi:hypothetical protein